MKVIDRRQVTITRDQVHDWYNEWKDGPGTTPLKDAIAAKVEEAGFGDSGVEIDGAAVPVADHILDDLRSYDKPESTARIIRRRKRDRG